MNDYVLSKDLQNTIMCCIRIAYWIDAHDKEMKQHGKEVKEICDSYKLDTKSRKATGSYGAKYIVVFVDGYLSLADTEKLIRQIKLNVSIYYCKGRMYTSYNNGSY